MLRNEVTRTGAFRPIPPGIRRQVRRSYCQICGRPYGKVYVSEGRMRCPRQHIEHCLSRRFLHEHKIYEHHLENLLSTCQYCGIPPKLEDRLYQGDVLGYLQGLKQLGYPIGRIIRFALARGLGEFGGVSV